MESATHLSVDTRVGATVIVEANRLGLHGALQQGALAAGHALNDVLRSVALEARTVSKRLLELLERHALRDLHAARAPVVDLLVCIINT